jgi:hypothetical protein
MDWLDGTWGRVMEEFGGIWLRTCEAFASSVPLPPCFL